MREILDPISNISAAPVALWGLGYDSHEYVRMVGKDLIDLLGLARGANELVRGSTIGRALEENILLLPLILSVP